MASAIDSIEILLEIGLHETCFPVSFAKFRFLTDSIEQFIIFNP